MKTLTQVHYVDNLLHLILNKKVEIKTVIEKLLKTSVNLIYLEDIAIDKEIYPTLRENYKCGILIKVCIKSMYEGGKLKQLNEELKKIVTYPAANSVVKISPVDNFEFIVTNICNSNGIRVW